MTEQTTASPAAPASATPTEDEPTGRLARLARLQALQIIIVLAVIVVIFSILKPSAFLTVFNIRGIVQNTAILAVLAVGMTFVIITGGIDLSIGSVLVFSGVVADKVMANIGGGQGWGSAIIGALVAIGCGLAWGLINGFLVARAKVPPLIVTLGTLGMALGLAEVITGGVDLRNVPTVMVNSVGFGNIVGEIPWLAVIAAVIVLLGIVLLHRTRFGLHTYAIGSNPEAGRRAGVNVPRHLVMIYALSGLLAGFAGWLNLAFFQSTTIGGQTATNLSVIAGTVIGGTSLFGGYGSIFGSIVGLFLPATLQDGFNFSITSKIIGLNMYMPVKAKLLGGFFGFSTSPTNFPFPSKLATPNLDGSFTFVRRIIASEFDLLNSSAYWVIPPLIRLSPR